MACFRAKESGKMHNIHCISFTSEYSNILPDCLAIGEDNLCSHYFLEFRNKINQKICNNLVILLLTNAHPLLCFYTSLYNLADMFRSVWTIIGASFTWTFSNGFIYFYLFYRVILQLIWKTQHTKYTTHLKHILNIDDCKDLYVWCKKIGKCSCKGCPDDGPHGSKHVG
jgi:hypothetical protein